MRFKISNLIFVIFKETTKEKIIKKACSLLILAPKLILRRRVRKDFLNITSLKSITEKSISFISKQLI